MFYFADDDGEEDGEEEESDDDEDDEDDGEMTLSDLYNKKLDDDEDGEDFVEGDEEEDDDEIDDEDEPSTKKPKVDNDGDANWNGPKSSHSRFLLSTKWASFCSTNPINFSVAYNSKIRRKWRKHFSVISNDSFKEEPLKKQRFLKKNQISGENFSLSPQFSLTTTTKKKLTYLYKLPRKAVIVDPLILNSVLLSRCIILMMNK